MIYLRNFRIIEEDRLKDDKEFGVYYVTYNEKGKIIGWATDPVSILEYSKKDILRVLECILHDVKKYPVLKMSELEKSK
jgi:hypothetical protein